MDDVEGGMDDEEVEGAATSVEEVDTAWTDDE